jgi:sigma-B regulation protein RsbU (phosphoserine phosphatase)
VAAALLMTSARALLRTRAGRIGSGSELMNELNRHLSADTPVGRFMTLFYMVLDADAKSVRWASAGHDPAIVYDPAADTFDELAGRDIPLGIELSWQYRESRRDRLPAGCVIVIGTDGIWEARNPRHEQFGKDRLRDAVRRNAGTTAAEIKRAITDSLRAFRQDVPQQDDVTLVVVKVLA